MFFTPSNPKNSTVKDDFDVAVYQTWTSISRVKSANTVSTISTGMESFSDPEEADWDMVPDVSTSMTAHHSNLACFINSTASRLETAKQALRLSLEDSNTLIEKLIARENLRFNGAKLTAAMCSQINIENLLDEIDLAYQKMSFTDVKKSKRRDHGYSLSDPSRLGEQLKQLGFSENDISAMRLSTIIKYDAILWVVLTGAIDEPFNTYKSELNEFMSDSSMELDTNFEMQCEAKKASDDFNALLSAALKDEIDQNISSFQEQYKIHKARFINHFKSMFDALSTDIETSVVNAVGMFRQPFEKPINDDKIVDVRLGPGSS